VVVVDLDDFAGINDVLGYEVGDHILTAVAGVLRDTARPQDTVGRLGGDQFGVLAPDITADDLDTMVERLRSTLAGPVVANGTPVSARAGIGVAHGTPGESGAGLLTKADIALRTAKATGRGRPEYFQSGMRVRFLDQAALVEGLHDAVTGGQMELVYQPIVRLEDNTLTGLEALARWRHPDRGPIMPGDFIPVAERSGLIVPLGRWMLEQVCHERGPDWPETYVNISAHQLREPGFAATVESLVTEPEQLIVEVTEDALTEESIVHALREVRDLGVRISLDDFGVGPASLTALATAPFDILKLHGSMTERIITSRRQALVARHVAELAAELGVTVIAKAVESAAQARMLHDLGYRQGMGFHYAVPQPATAIPLFLADAGFLTPLT
jgi:diguanylate cyclase (GGDEF)-like protein